MKSAGKLRGYIFLRSDVGCRHGRAAYLRPICCCLSIMQFSEKYDKMEVISIYLLYLYEKNTDHNFAGGFFCANKHA
jgi:hypothetical protein